MADYYPLIAKAVAGLDKSTGEARRALYERARTALVTQLRGVVPALSESEITRERLALEEAIRKVEAEAARKSRFDAPPERKRLDRDAPDPFKAPTPPRPASSPASNGASDDAGAESTLSRTAADLRRRSTPPPERSPMSGNGLQGFRNVVADAENLGDATAQAGRSAREAYNAVPAPSPEFDRLEPRLEPDGLRARDRRPAAREQRRDSVREQPTREQPTREQPAREQPSRQPPARVPPPRETMRDPAPRDRSIARPPARDLGRHDDLPDFDLSEPPRADEFSARDFAPEPDFEADFAQMREPDQDRDAGPARGRARRRAEPADHGDDARAREAIKPRGRLFVYLAIVFVLLVGGGTLAWKWQPVVDGLRGLLASTRPSPTAPAQENAAPQNRKMTDRIGANDTGGQNAAPAGADVAQRVVLYEEDPADPKGKRYVGSAVWHVETVSPGANQPLETVVRADIDIPERKMTMRWTLQRNLDKAMPASHTVEVVFTLPSNFPHQGIQNVPGVLMKENEQTRGVPLSGLAVKVTDGYFLIGLSASDTDMQRNIALLKDRPWFDVPIVYADGRRAILAVEKGTPGDRAFAQAFQAWKQ